MDSVICLDYNSFVPISLFLLLPQLYSFLIITCSTLAKPIIITHHPCKIKPLQLEEDFCMDLHKVCTTVTANLYVDYTLSAFSD